MTTFARALALLVLAGSVARPLGAQCAQWDSTFNLPGADAPVGSLVVLDDGSGPALYAVGSFTTIGGVSAPRIARFDGAGWSAVGDFGPTPRVLTVFDDGTGPALVAGGSRALPFGQHESRVARWDGANWIDLGTGSQFFTVTCLAVYGPGSGPALFLGGYGQPGPFGVGGSVMRWNGTSWSSIGGADGAILALAVYDDGVGAGPALFVGGNFLVESSSFTSTPGLARWNGTSWSSSGGFAHPSKPTVSALTVFDDGSGLALYACGDFVAAGGVPASNIVRRLGTTWSALGPGIGFGAQALAGLDDGDGRALFAAGNFTSAGGSPATRIARWDGSRWTALGAGIGVGGQGGSVRALAAFDDGADGDPDLYVGGLFVQAGPSAASNLARWAGCGVLAFCSGDGSAGACPCANAGSAGRGCDNSIASGGALLSASGTSHPDALVITSSGELPSALSIFLQGDLAIAPVTFGDGLRCAGGNLKRLYVQNAVAGTASAPQPGDPSITQRSAALGDPIAPGSARYYQVYYRDPDLAFCPSGGSFNASNALRVVW